MGLLLNLLLLTLLVVRAGWNQGTCNTTLNEMASEGLGNEWDLINPKKIPGGKKAKKGYKNSGVLSLLSIAIEEEKGFVEYLAAGLQLNFSVAIDFTASNGAANQPTSLHYMNPYQPNPYVYYVYYVC